MKTAELVGGTATRRRTPVKPEHPVTRYARQVVSGEIVAGEMVRLAGARHLRDLERQNTDGFLYHFDEELAHGAFDFFEEKLCLYEGEMEGEPFELFLWQMFVVGSVFGWVDRAGMRRFQTAYIETGKGSGKSPMAGGIALKGLCDDGEPGAQVFFGGALRTQSEVPFRDARTMAKVSPELAGKLHITEHNIDYPAGNGFLRPISSEAGNLTGKRVHIGIIEELHEHKDATVISAMRKGTKSRRQPLIAIITNSGQDRRSVCWEYHEYSRKVLDQSLVDEQWFAYVCQLDVCAPHVTEGKDMPVDGCPKCDQWTDERVWLKANPSLKDPRLPLSIPGMAYLRQQVLEAASMPSVADETKRLNACIWTSGKVQWIRPEVWRLQASPKKTKGRLCYAGYDLSAVNDLTAAAYIFPDTDAIDIKLRIFLPEARIDQLAASSRVPYRQWADEGFITLTPGETLNYDFVEAEDERMRAKYQVVSSGIDPWQAIQFRADLEQKGVTIEKVPQTNQNLHAVVEEFERLLQVKGVRHGGHPVLEWVASNVILNIDARGNKRIDKQTSPEKIDPIAAILNALAVSMTAVPPKGPSVYERRGVLSV